MPLHRQEQCRGQNELKSFAGLTGGLRFRPLDKRGRKEPATYLYRYRPASAVLDEFEELEQEGIYFSTAEELKDPMEGFQRPVLVGRRDCLAKPLKHYVFCLLEMTYHAFVMRPEFDRKYIERVALAAPDSLPDAPIKGIYTKATARLASDAVPVNQCIMTTP